MSRPFRSGAHMEAMESRRLFSGINHMGGIGYLPSDEGAKLQRYDIAAQKWLAPITLTDSPGGATATLVDAGGIYVAYGQSVVRYKLDGSAPTHLINTANTVQDIHSDGNVLFLNHSSGLYARFISISKQTNTIINTVEKYVDSVYGSSLSTSANRIFGRSNGISPPDITYMAYDNAGNFTGGGGSPYHGDYANASTTWVFPEGTKVVDDSGGVYAASSLTRLNSFNTAIDDVTFVGNDVPIVLRANTLTAYSSTILPTGSKALARPATQILANGTNVIAFNPAPTLANRYDVQIVPLADLKAAQPDQPVNPVDLAYTPEHVEATSDGTLLILDAETESIFRWNTSTREYGATIPLIDVPKFMAYSAQNNAVYVAYASGLVNRIDLGAASPAETPFAILPGAPHGLATAGQYMFAADGSGAWGTHYTFGPAGNAISAVDWNRYSSEYIWSPATSRMYFFRDGTSPNDLHSELIGADGTISAGLESPLHTSEGFVHPIRVSPDGGIVVLGSGLVHDAKTLARLTGGLGNPISDVAWLNGAVYTVRSIAGYAQFQEWVGSTFAPGAVLQVEGKPERLLTVEGNLVGIYTPASGVPQFRLMGADLQPVIPLPPPPATTDIVAGNVFADVAADGVRNAGDDMVGGFRVFLDRNGDGWWNPGEIFTRTDEVGRYSLSDVPAGLYWLRVTHIDGWRFTTNDAFRVRVAPGGEVIRHFGVTRDAGTIAGSVFNDLNADAVRREGGVLGFRVFVDADNDGVWDKGESFAFSAGDNGWYEFPDLPAGNHWLRISSGNGWRATTSVGYRVNVDAGNTLIRHFGVTRNVLILGHVFMDANVSGGKDAAEDGLPGWTVFVDADNDGVLDPDEVSVRTDAAGRYAIRTLAGDRHRIRVVQSPNYRRTAPAAGYRDVSLMPGEIVTGVNFGQKRILMR